MTPGLVVKLRPTTPWRPGSDSGARDQVETLYHSDSLYSAVSAAMARLGMLEEWLDATARAPGGAEVCLSSCFPFQNNLMMVVPPRNFWPPAPSPRVRWNSARFIPLSLLALLLRGRAPDEERWMVDGASGCLVASGTAGPFRVARRSQAAVDRVNGAQAPQSWACLEFTPGAGLWTTAVFAGEEAGKRWMEPVRAAFRLLADTGFGGRRSIGWGRCAAPEFLEGAFPEVVLPPEWPAPAPPPGNQEEPAAGPEAVAWLWSLFVPAALDAIDWRRGFYSLASRTGRIESPAAAGGLKQSVNMVEEGSVLFAGGAIRGSAVDVAPDGFSHPVYRAGFAVAVSVPWIPGYPGAVLPPDGEHKPVGRPKEAGEQGERSLALLLPLAGEKEETPAVEEPSAVSTQPSAEPEAAVETAPAVAGPDEPGEAAAGAQEQVAARIEEAEEPPAVEEPSAVSIQPSAEPEAAAAAPEEPGEAEAGAQEQVTARIEEAEEPPAVEEPSAVSTQPSAEPEAAAAVPEEPGEAEAGGQEQVAALVEEAEEPPAAEEPTTVSTQPAGEPEAAAVPEEPGEAEAGAQEQVAALVEEAEEPPSGEEPPAVSTQPPDEAGREAEAEGPQEREKE